MSYSQEEAAYYSLPGTQAVQLDNGTWRPGGYVQQGYQWVRPQEAGTIEQYGGVNNPTLTDYYATVQQPAGGAAEPAANDPFAGIDWGALQGGGGYSPQAFDYAAFNYGGRVTPGGFSYGTFQGPEWKPPTLLDTLGEFDFTGDPYQSKAFEYTGPEYISEAFRAPDEAAVYADPGYQFRLKAGQEALERSAAARGTLLTGGTMKDLTAYQQDLASQEYQKAYDRALQMYQLDDARQFRDYQTAYNRQFGEWQSEDERAFRQYQTDYDRQFGEWQAESNRRQLENQLTWDRALQTYQTNYNRLFGEHQQGYNQARDAYAFTQADLAREYERALQEYQMGYAHARDNWQTAEQGRASAAAASDRRRQDQIDFLMKLAGL